MCRQSARSNSVLSRRAIFRSSFTFIHPTSRSCRFGSQSYYLSTIEQGQVAVSREFGKLLEWPLTGNRASSKTKDQLSRSCGVTAVPVIRDAVCVRTRLPWQSRRCARAVFTDKLLLLVEQALHAIETGRNAAMSNVGDALALAALEPQVLVARILVEEISESTTGMLAPVKTLQSTSFTPQLILLRLTSWNPYASVFSRREFHGMLRSWQAHGVRADAARFAAVAGICVNLKQDWHPLMLISQSRL